MPLKLVDESAIEEVNVAIVRPSLIIYTEVILVASLPAEATPMDPELPLESGAKYSLTGLPAVTTDIDRLVTDTGDVEEVVKDPQLGLIATPPTPTEAEGTVKYTWSPGTPYASCWFRVFIVA